MPQLPSGTVTFLFTDIEGSTRLWARDAGAMSAALRVHDEIVRSAVERHYGYVFATGGDSFAVAFDRVSSAIEVADQVQVALASASWPEGFGLRVRVGIHVGVAEERDGDYFGPTVNAAARLSAAGHGGQTLITAHALHMKGGDVPPALMDLGEHGLRDVDGVVHIFQLGSGSFPQLRTASVGIMSIPSPRTSLIGRESAVDEIRKLLVDRRLVTLTGVGGCGKTRLALEVAQREAPSHPQGVWFVDLAVIADDDAVAGAFCSALEISVDSHAPVVDQIATYLAHRDALLVVDNCEHVLDEVAELLDALLARTDQLRVLATSREALEIGGEQSWRVPSLPTGPDSAAVRLFVDRALTSTGDFEPDGAAVAAIAEISERLDGIPLAIELAAARVRTMSVAQLRDNLDDRFRLLSGGRRRSRQRQQTLEATVRWSYELLTSDEQTMLRTLAVFQGGFELDDVAAVSNVSFGVAVDLVDALVAKSLVTVTRAHGDSVRRYLLETIRLFSLQELIDSGESQPVRDRHLDHFLADPRVHDWGAWSTPQGQSRIEREFENLRAALHWASEIGRLDAVVVIAGALYDVLTEHGQIGEALAWLDHPLAAEGDRATETRRRTIVAFLKLQQFDLVAAKEGAASAIELASGQPYDLVPFAHFVLGRARSFLGEAGIWQETADVMHAIAPHTPSAVTNIALARLAETVAAVAAYDLDRVVEVASRAIVEAPDYHGRDLFELFRASAQFLQNEPVTMPSDHVDAASGASVRFATPWTYIHTIMRIIVSSDAITPAAAAVALAEVAPEIVARRPGITGDVVIAFALLHTEMGDLARAEQLSAGSEPFNNVLLALAVRKRLGRPAAAASGVESMLERLASQPGLLQEEIDRWTPARTTHLA